MSGHSFRASIRTRNDAVIIDFQGHLTEQSAGVLIPIFSEAIRMSKGTVILNFKHVIYMTTAGISQVIAFMAQERAMHRIISVALNDHYLYLFKIMRLTDFVQNYPDEQSAIAGLTSSP